MSSAVRVDAPSADPAAFAAEVHEGIAAGARLRLQVGDATCDVDGDLAKGIVALLAAVGAGQSVDIAALPPEMTTGQAAAMLGVSRPTVVALVDKGAIPASRVGSHRRIRTLDLLAYREQKRHERSIALDDLAEVSGELGLYDE
jgi:excisionase family DNA binding protein